MASSDFQPQTAAFAMAFFGPLIGAAGVSLMIVCLFLWWALLIGFFLGFVPAMTTAMFYPGLMRLAAARRRPKLAAAVLGGAVSFAVGVVASIFHLMIGGDGALQIDPTLVLFFSAAGAASAPICVAWSNLRVAHGSWLGPAASARAT